MSSANLAPGAGGFTGFWGLLARYLSFVWLFEAVPIRADVFTRSRIDRTNRDRGLRYLPLYLARYLRLLCGFAFVGAASEAIAAPAVIVGACFTLSSVAAVAATVAAVGLAGFRVRHFSRRS